MLWTSLRFARVPNFDHIYMLWSTIKPEHNDLQIIALIKTIDYSEHGPIYWLLRKHSRRIRWQCKLTIRFVTVVQKLEFQFSRITVNRCWQKRAAHNVRSVNFPHEISVLCLTTRWKSSFSNFENADEDIQVKLSNILRIFFF